MRKALIITYYWPPAGGPGVQRVLKFVKYLPEFGWQPLVLTVKKGEYPAIDNKISDDVSTEAIINKTKAFEPYFYYKRFLGQEENEKVPVGILTHQDLSWKQKIANFIRLNIFIPDAKIGWIPFAVSTGKQLIKNEKPAAIFTSSPPATAHLIGKKLAKWSKLPWVADFRDPWTNIYHYDQRPKMYIAQKIDKYLERRVLYAASKITVVSPGFFNHHFLYKTKKISNGYDLADLKTGHGVRSDKFIIRYMGSLKIRQFVETFFKILNELSVEKEFIEKMQVEFIGYVDPLVQKYIKEKNISLNLKFYGYVPHYEAIKLISQANMLLHVVGKSEYATVVTGGKLFEYMMVKRPILSYGPKNGETDRLLQETKCGKLFDFEDKLGAKTYLLDQYKNWKNKRVNFHPVISKIEQYNRKNLTKKLTQTFEEII